MLVCSVPQSCLTLPPHGLQPTRLLCPWNFPGRNTGVGCHFLFQGIFLIQGLNLYLLHLLHQQVDFLPLHHLGSHPSPTPQKNPAPSLGRLYNSAMLWSSLTDLCHLLTSSESSLCGSFSTYPPWVDGLFFFSPNSAIILGDLTLQRAGP